MTTAARIAGFGESLPLQRRLDLQFRRLQSGNVRARWGVKDPVALRYFQLEDEEYVLLQLLDGRVGLRELRSELERRFPGRRVTLSELHAFLANLHQSGLILSETAGQGGQLFRRREQSRRRQWFSALGNLLAIRFRGFHPGQLLDWLTRRCAGLFSTTAMVVAAILVVAAVVLAGSEIRTIRSMLPEFRELFTPANLVLMFVSVAAVKVLHELGHAITCRRFGQECHEMGLMLFVGMPTLYCNVSDAWMLPDKRARMAISAAGIVVELVLAALCTFLWWFSVPGTFHWWCLNMMMVCSVQTIVFNANPLLRYDGYYFLSDWLEIPNLGDQAKTAVRDEVLSRWFDLPRAVPQSRLRAAVLVAYGVASAVYRVVVMLGIVWFLHRVLEPYRLEMVADLLGVTIGGGLLMGGVTFSREIASEVDQRRDEFDSARASRRIGATLLVLAGICLIPWPRWIAAPGVLEPAGASRIYNTVPGTVEFALPAGSIVQKGQRLVQLKNLELQGELEKLKGERDVQSNHLTNLERRRIDDPALESQIPSARAMLVDLDERVARKSAEVRELTVQSPGAGRLFPPPRDTRSQPEGLLSKRQGTPLDPSNLRSTVETGTLLGMVGDPNQLGAVLVVSQTDVADIAIGQEAQLLVPDTENRIQRGKVLEISANDLKIVPRELQTTPEIATRPDASGRSTASNVSYRVKIALESPCQLPVGTHCRGKIKAEPMSLLGRTLRFVRQTFQLH